MGKWSDETLERATEMWQVGHTADEVARALGGGLSRNAVAGMMHRLGLTRAAAGPRQRRSPPQRKDKVSKSLPAPRPAPPEPKFTGPMNNIPDGPTCHFPRGDPGRTKWQMCGAPGFPWCEYHSLLVFNRGGPPAAPAEAS